MRFFFVATFSLWMFGALAYGSVPTEQLYADMEKIIEPLHTHQGWLTYIKDHPELFGQVSEKNPDGFLEVMPNKVTIDGDEYIIGEGCRSVYVAATPKTIVGILTNPHFLQSMFGLDKPADIYPIEADGSYKTHVFKLVPGIETQDYTLDFHSQWQSDGSWISQSKQVKDEKGFALRDNISIIEPAGSGSVYREVSLLYPNRWWVRLFHGLAQKIFKKELGKLNKSLKCVAEKVQSGTAMGDDLAKACYKESQK